MNSHIRYWTVLVLLTSFNLLSLAQDTRPLDPNNHFINPPAAGPSYSEDDTVFRDNKNFTVGTPADTPWRWLTNMTRINFSLIQYGNPDFVKQRKLTDCPKEKSDASILYWDGEISPIDLSIGAVAFIGAYDCDAADGIPVFLSHYFNITEPQSSAATNSSSSTERASASPATNTSPTSSGATASPSPPDVSKNNSSNVGALAGGIGGGIGGALVICAVIAIVLWQRRNRRKDRLAAAAAEGHSSYFGSSMPAGKSSDTAWGSNRLLGVPVQSMPGELDATESRGLPVDHDRKVLSRTELDSSTINSRSQ